MLNLEIQFLDLKTQYHSIKDEILPEIESVLNSSAFVLGPKVKAFEESFALYIGVKHAIGVSNGTDALTLALVAQGIGPGDEVIVPANTFIATAEAVSHSGAKPIFVDVNPRNYLIDSKLIEQKITKHTKAIIPVHLYGQTANMDEILHIAKKHNLIVIEDACQAHGATFNGKKAGSMGNVGCFSFYPGKNLGAYGEGGACVTNSDEIAAKIRLFRDHGSEKKYYHDEIGYNFRMHGIQGAVLNVKLKYLDKWNSSRIKNAEIYSHQLKDVLGVIIPEVMNNNKHIFHLYVIQVEQDRDEFINKLKEKGITALIHYPIPIHLQKAYAHLGHKAGDFPVSETVAKKIISLPMYPELSIEQITYVCDTIKKIVDEAQ